MFDIEGNCINSHCVGMVMSMALFQTQWHIYETRFCHRVYSLVLSSKHNGVLETDVKGDGEGDLCLCCDWLMVMLYAAC